MKNKILASVSMLVLTLGLFSACEENENFRDANVTAVEKLYEPADEKYTSLQSSGSMYFEWEKAYSDDNSVVYYEVLFDIEDGDFSDPVYIVTSDNKGLSTGATVTHKTMNKIATLAGIELAQIGTLKWTVRSGRGIKFQMAEEIRTISLVRLNSIDDLEGGDLFITGEASEEGQQFKATSTIGVYQIYTKLEAGKAYSFYSEVAGTKRTFQINDDQTSFRETYTEPEGTTVGETSAYRITLDFEAASARIEKISKLELVVSWSQRKSELTYQAGGVWKMTAYNVQLTATSWGFDERYKFVFIIDGQEEHWGQFGPHFDDRPSINRAGYRDMAPTEGGQWGGSQFKFPTELCDGSNLSRYYTDVTVYMTQTADGNYTHDFTNITE